MNNNLEFENEDPSPDNIEDNHPRTNYGEGYAGKETLEETAEIDLTKLCYYDKRNPDFQIKEEYGYDKEEVEATGNFAKKDCACDNCFYGRSKLTEQLIRQQERRYSEEEAFNLCREFAIFVQHNGPSYKKQQEWFEQYKKK